jgi:hypothetical protein
LIDLVLSFLFRSKLADIDCNGWLTYVMDGGGGVVVLIFNESLGEGDRKWGKKRKKGGYVMSTSYFTISFSECL